MPTNSPQPPERFTIPLSVAREALKSPRDLDALVDRLGDLSEESIEDLGPLVFDVLRLESDFPVADILKRMLDKRPEWVNQKIRDTYSLLNETLMINRFDLLEVLIDAGVDPTYETPTGFSILDGLIVYANTVEADFHTQQACMNALLEKGNFSSRQKDAALAKAARTEQMGTVTSLLAHGAGFSIELPDGIALATACGKIKEGNQLDLVQAMLQAPGVSHIIDFGWGHPNSSPAIGKAAREGNVQVISMLLDAGARINPPEHLKNAYRTPLMEAARHLQPEAMDLLIKSGADATTIDNVGGNAFHHLATHFPWGSLNCEKPTRIRAIELLIEAGADPMQKDHLGHTPLDVARQRGSAEVIEDFSALAARHSSHHLSRDTPRPVERRKTSARRL